MFRQEAANSASIFGGDCDIDFGRVFVAATNFVRLVGIGLGVDCGVVTVLGSDLGFDCVVVSLCDNGFVLGRAVVLLLGSGFIIGLAVELLIGSGFVIGCAVMLLIDNSFVLVDGRGCWAAPLGPLIKPRHDNFFHFIRFAVIENIVRRSFLQNNCWIILAVAPTSLDTIANIELIGMLDVFIRHINVDSMWYK